MSWSRKSRGSSSLKQPPEIRHFFLNFCRSPATNRVRAFARPLLQTVHPLLSPRQGARAAPWPCRSVSARRPPLGRGRHRALPQKKGICPKATNPASCVGFGPLAAARPAVGATAPSHRKRDLSEGHQPGVLPGLRPAGRRPPGRGRHRAHPQKKGFVRKPPIRPTAWVFSRNRPALRAPGYGGKSGRNSAAARRSGRRAAGHRRPGG